MPINIGSIVASMVSAAKTSFGKDWPKAKDYAKPEFQKLAKSLVDIGKLVADGKVTQQQAKSLLGVHKNTTRMVFLTVEGLGIIAVENAINAAIKSVRDTVNAAIGFVLL